MDGCAFQLLFVCVLVGTCRYFCVCVGSINAVSGKQEHIWIQSHCENNFYPTLFSSNLYQYNIRKIVSVWILGNPTICWFSWIIFLLPKNRHDVSNFFNQIKNSGVFLRCICLISHLVIMWSECIRKNCIKM